MLDYYAILGVHPSASKKEIKKAYRRLAMEYHPDKNQTKEAKRRFDNIQKAYEVLTKPQPQIEHSEQNYEYYKYTPQAQAAKPDKYETLKTYAGVFAFLCTTTLIGLALYSWGTKYKISQAWEAYQAQEYQVAETHLLHVLESDASNIHANKLMAKMLVEQKRASSLLFALSAAEQEEENSATLTYLSLSYLISRDVNSAEAALYQALHFNDKYDSANMLMGYILHAKGRDKESKEFLEKVKEKQNYVGLMEYIH